MKTDEQKTRLGWIIVLGCLGIYLVATACMVIESYLIWASQ